MGKVLLYTGVGILVLVRCILFFSKTELVSELAIFHPPTVLACGSYLLGFALTVVGGLICIYNFISDRLPY